MSSTERQAYDTHFRYISCLQELVKDAKLIYTGSLKNAPTPFLGEKKNLIELTKQSLNDERRIVDIDQDYSYASTSWLPIKSYYLIFNILLTVEYLFKLQKNVYRVTHHSCIEEFTRKLEAKEIQFSEPLLNQVFDESILNHKIVPGSNLSTKTSRQDMYKMVMRKIGWDKEEEWKRKHNINLRRHTDKAKFKKYLTTEFKVSIFDFAYQMRLRSNYRDFAFIDGITTAETAEYFRRYFTFVACFVRALEQLRRRLLLLRSISIQ